VFAWWGAKEAKSSGVTYYLQNQTDDFKSHTTANIHLDMLGSQNYIPYVSIHVVAYDEPVISMVTNQPYFIFV
jgi:Zn-dependent M28 family amino/carboxypeptidase